MNNYSVRTADATSDEDVELGVLLFEDGRLVASHANPEHPGDRSLHEFWFALIPGATPDEIAAQFPNFTLTQA